MKRSFMDKNATPTTGSRNISSSSSLLPRWKAATAVNNAPRCSKVIIWNTDRESVWMTKLSFLTSLSNTASVSR